MSPWRPVTLTAGFLILLPTAARANVGSAMMMAGYLQFLFLNWMIGLGEAVLATRILRVRFSRTIAPCIAANYFSGLIGWMAIGTLTGWALALLPGEAPLFKLPSAIGLLWLTALLLSLVLELPFHYLIARRTERPLRRALHSCLAAQIVSYALLYPFYQSFSVRSLYEEVRVERSLDFGPKPPARVFYFGTDGWVRRVNTDGTERIRVVRPDALPTYPTLALRTDPATTRSDLVVKWEELVEGQGSQTRSRTVAKGVAAAQADMPPAEPWMPVDLRPEKDRGIRARAGAWASDGLWVNAGERNSYSVAVDTPFAGWRASHVTLLPGDYAVFQLGPQVVLLDLKARKLGLLALGDAPAVAIE